MACHLTGHVSDELFTGCGHYLHVMTSGTPYLDPLSSSELLELADLLASLAADHQPQISARDKPDAYWAAVDRLAEVGKQQGPFAGFHRMELRRILADARVRDCSAGLRLIGRNEHGRTAYVVIAGELEVRAGARRFTLGPGEICGELAVLTGESRTADVFVGAAGARVLVLEEMILRSIIGCESNVAARVLGNLARILATRVAARGAASQQ
jgi:CPA1 family monovalent cation:H+ antiporter